MNRGILMVLLVADLIVIGASVMLLGSSVKKHWFEVNLAPVALMPVQSFKLEPQAQPQASPPPIQETVPAENQEAKEEPKEPKIEPKSVKKEFPPKKVIFKYTDAIPKRVAIVGDFNQWSPQLMKKDKQHNWTIAQELKPGRYAYNFIVDGKMIRDPSNTRTKGAGQKILSSLLIIKAK